MKNNIKIDKYIETIGSINTLLKIFYRQKVKTTNDGLVQLYRELLNIIFYGEFDDLVTYSKKVYDINITVNPNDPLGSRIKDFILLYVNDSVETILNNYENK